MFSFLLGTDMEEFVPASDAALTDSSYPFKFVKRLLLLVTGASLAFFGGDLVVPVSCLKPLDSIASNIEKQQKSGILLS